MLAVLTKNQGLPYSSSASSGATRTPRRRVKMVIVQAVIGGRLWGDREREWT